jgi:hypothetical protein
VLRHADTSVCSPERHDISHHPPPPLRQLSAPPHTVSIGFSGAYPSTCCAPNRRSNPIVHRVRRKRQRLPPSLLIENASERLPLPTRSVMPRRFRSRLATIRESMATNESVGTYAKTGSPVGSCCEIRFSFDGWRCGVQVLFLLVACCTDDWQSIGGYVA